MKKLFQNQKVIGAVRTLRPWAIVVFIVLILRYTGTLAGVSLFANTALPKTEKIEIDLKTPKPDEVFDYNFSIKDLNGKVIDMAQFKGKVLFINLWATWCGPCIDEMPSIQNLYNKVDKNKIVFIALNWFEKPRRVSKFINKHKFTFPMYLVNKDVSAQLTVPMIPTTFVISPDGKIMSKKTGLGNYDTEEFKKVLEELAVGN